MDFTAFDTRKIDEYAKRAKEQWGKTEEYREFEEKAKNWTKDDETVMMHDFMQIFAEFGQMKELSPSETSGLITLPNYPSATDFNDLLDWIKTNVVAEKTKYVSGNANGYSGGSYYYYEGSFTVDGIVKTAVFTGNVNADDKTISHSGNTITYKLSSKTAGKYVSGNIKYTFSMA